MCEILAFEADRRAFIITINSFGTELTKVSCILVSSKLKSDFLGYCFRHMPDSSVITIFVQSSVYLLPRNVLCLLWIFPWLVLASSPLKLPLSVRILWQTDFYFSKNCLPILRWHSIIAKIYPSLFFNNYLGTYHL